ncbi:hypothetical protein Anas_12422, partial [Armadillidium nasatum]
MNRNLIKKKKKEISICLTPFLLTSYQGSIPVTFTMTAKRLPQKPGQFNAYQALIKASAAYIRGVYLPWSLKSHNAITWSNIELNIPVGKMEERILGTEGPIRTSKTHYNFAFEKKFPVLRLSETPNTITFSFNPVSHGPERSFIGINTFSVEERVFSKVDPFTGIKYDLKMKVDPKADLGFNDFRKFPKYFH